MYECFEMHDDWHFIGIILQRQTNHWNIGYVMARALAYICKSSSSGDVVVWRHTKTIVEDRGSNPVYRLAGSKTFWWYCYCWTLYCRAHSGYRICGQCFLHVRFCLFFFFYFFIPFLPGSPFRVFNPPEINSFHMPLSCLNCLWRLSIHRGAHFCLSRPFGFST